MGSEAITFLALVGASAGVFYALRKQRERRLSLERLERVFTIEEPDEPPIAARPILARRPWIAWATGLTFAFGMHFLFGFRWVYSGSAGLMISLLGGQVEAMFVERRMQKIETQLADAIDLMVGGLRAGAGVLNCLENAAHETRSPLKPQLDEVVGRVRLGDDAQDVFQALAARTAGDVHALLIGTGGPLGSWRKPGTHAGDRGTHDPRSYRAHPPNPLDDGPVADVDHRGADRHLRDRGNHVVQRPRSHGTISDQRRRKRILRRCRRAASCGHRVVLGHRTDQVLTRPAIMQVAVILGFWVAVGLLLTYYAQAYLARSQIRRRLWESSIAVDAMDKSVDPLERLAHALVIPGRFSSARGTDELRSRYRRGDRARADDCDAGAPIGVDCHSRGCGR